jgi:hypothetical protein
VALLIAIPDLTPMTRDPDDSLLSEAQPSGTRPRPQNRGSIEIEDEDENEDDGRGRWTRTMDEDKAPVSPCLRVPVSPCLRRTAPHPARPVSVPTPMPRNDAAKATSSSAQPAISSR